VTDTLNPPVRPYADDSPLAYLMDLAAEAHHVPTDDEQREDAVTTAAHHIYDAYHSTIGQVLDAGDWRGYPALRPSGSPEFEPSAVAWLDGGLWLHHTLRTDINGAVDVLALVVPCTCGQGYTDIVLDTEDDLLEILAGLHATNGRSPHDASHPDCHSVRSVRAL
jgi:hypothetical protein